MLWTKESFAGDIRVGYEFTRQPSSEGANLLYIQAQGIGMPPYDEDIYVWRELREIPSMDKYFNYMDLMSLSLREDIRCRRYPWSDVERGIDFENKGLYEPKIEDYVLQDAVRYHLEVEKRKTSYRLRIRDLDSDTLVVDHTWNLSENTENRYPPYIENGRIGLRLMGGHKILVRDFKVERL